MSNDTLAPLETEVLVVGSGAAGITAALAAARNGADTLLVEYQGFLGGLSTTMPWLGFHDRDYRQVVKGLGTEFVTRLQQSGDASPFVFDPKCLSVVSLNGHAWKCLAMDLAGQAGVRRMLHTQVVDTLRQGDRIAGVVVQHKSGRQEIRARVTIDASGDGDVAARGGVPCEKGRPEDGLVQSPTLVFRVGGVDRAGFVAACRDKDLKYREWLVPFPELWKKMMRRMDDLPVFVVGGFAPLLEQARAAGDLHVPQTRIVGVKLHRHDQFLAVMTRVLGLNPTSVTSLTEAYARTYQQIPELVRFFRKYVPGFGNAVLEEIAPMLGVRESRRIKGDYILSGDDMVAGRAFPDAVCMGAYHIDIHRPAGTWVESRNVRAYTIPLRSLIAGGVDGLLMAGKCLSATHEAEAGTRVVPICMGQGQAVGTVAALAVRSGVGAREVPIARLQDTLAQQGAEFGQSVGLPNHQAIEQVGQLPFEEPPSTGDRDGVSSQQGAWIS